MKKMRLVPKMLVLAAAIMTATNPVYAKDTLQEQFSSPPDTSKPRAWWHWINGNITANGVEKDLLWMKQVPSHAVPARAVSLENLPPTWIGVGSIDLFFLERISFLLKGSSNRVFPPNLLSSKGRTMASTSWTRLRLLHDALRNPCWMLSEKHSFNPSRSSETPALPLLMAIRLQQVI